MMRKFIACIISTFLLTAVYAQQNKIVSVGVQKFTSERSQYAESAAELRSQINEIINSKKHIKTLDRTLDDAVMQELDVQKNIEYLRGVTVAQGKAVGAMMLLTGTVTSISISENQVRGLPGMGGMGVKTETCKLRFSLTLLDVETGTSIDSKTFDVQSTADVSVSGRGMDQRKDPLKNAVANSKKVIAKEVGAWINMAIPPNITLAMIDSRDKKGFPKTVSITPDAGIEFSKGALIAVNEIISVDVNGVKKTKIVRIATLKVQETQGDFISCEVKDGEDVLEDKWKNSRIQLIPTDKK